MSTVVQTLKKITQSKQDANGVGPNYPKTTDIILMASTLFVMKIATAASTIKKPRS